MLCVLCGPTALFGLNAVPCTLPACLEGAVLVWPGADALARIIREVASHVGIVPSPWPSPALGRGDQKMCPSPSMGEGAGEGFSRIW